MKINSFQIGEKRTSKVKLTDLFLYFCIFGGITLVSGTIVHALEFSMASIIIFIIGIGMTIFGTLAHDKLFVDSRNRKEIGFKNFGANIIIAVSSGSIAGAILHWEEGPKFSLFLIICGFVISIITTLLYDMRKLKAIFLNYFIQAGMFSGMSFVSGTIVHSINDWFNNYSLIFIGLILTVGCTLMNENLYKKRTLKYFLKETTILLFLTLGMGLITGGLLHFNVSVYYSFVLIIIGVGVCVSTSMFKSDGNLIELRN